MIAYTEYSINKITIGRLLGCRFYTFYVTTYYEPCVTGWDLPSTVPAHKTQIWDDKLPVRVAPASNIALISAVTSTHTDGRVVTPGSVHPIET